MMLFLFIFTVPVWDFDERFSMLPQNTKLYAFAKIAIPKQIYQSQTKIIRLPKYYVKYWKRIRNRSVNDEQIAKSMEWRYTKCIFVRYFMTVWYADFVVTWCVLISIFAWKMCSNLWIRILCANIYLYSKMSGKMQRNEKKKCHLGISYSGI